MSKLTSRGDFCRQSSAARSPTDSGFRSNASRSRCCRIGTSACRQELLLLSQGKLPEQSVHSSSILSPSLNTRPGGSRRRIEGRPVYRHQWNAPRLMSAGKRFVQARDVLRHVGSAGCVCENAKGASKTCDHKRTPLSFHLHVTLIPCSMHSDALTARYFFHSMASRPCECENMPQIPD
jgi:hypothetical protein